MDWDKLRVFHVTAEAGSFTHAGEQLSLSQSAVSRQISGLERDLNVTLFHRHHRGLVLTEQGELLFRTADDVFNRLKRAETLLADTKSKPSGELRVTTTVGLGTSWLTPRVREFIEFYPDVQLQIILSDEEVDLIKREADVAIWLREPSHNDLIRRRLFRVNFHVYASSDYVRRRGAPQRLSDLDRHHIITLGGTAPSQLKPINWLETVQRDGQPPRKAALSVNNLLALKQAVARGIGIAILPDYMARDEEELVPVLNEAEVPSFETYLVYAEELRNSKRISIFRDFIVAKAREWSF